MLGNLGYVKIVINNFAQATIYEGSTPKRAARGINSWCNINEIGSNLKPSPYHSFLRNLPKFLMESRQVYWAP